MENVQMNIKLFNKAIVRWCISFEFVLFSSFIMLPITTYRHTLGPIRASIQYVQGQGSRSVQLTTHVHLVPKLIVRGNFSSFSHTSRRSA